MKRLLTLARPQPAHRPAPAALLALEDGDGSRNFTQILVGWQNAVPRPSDKGGQGAWEEGRGRPGPQVPQPCFTCCSPGTLKDMRSQKSHHRLTALPSLLGVPSPSWLRLPDTDPKSTGGGGRAAAPPSPTPPPHRAHCLLSTRDQLRPPLSIDGHRASTGKPVPGACARPRGPAQGGALLSSQLKAQESLVHKHKIGPWHFIQTPEIGTHF